jgi:hypothetical protein
MVLINDQLSAQDTDLKLSETTTFATTTTESPEQIETEKAKAFYGKLHEILKIQNSLFIQRVDCMIRKLKDENTFNKVNSSNYQFTKAENGYIVTFKEAGFSEIQASIDSAAFSCTIVGLCAIVLIVFVMTVLVFCVKCLSKKKIVASNK